MILPVSQIETLRLNEVKWLAQGHKSSEWPSLEANLGILTLSLFKIV